jgi:hypothetical protein
MVKRAPLVAAIALVAMACSPSLAKQNGPGFRSAFSSLHECKIAKRGQAVDDLTRQCGGVLGYSLLLQESDARASIDVKTPSGKIYPLEYWNVISNDFSAVGKQAEWRVSIANGKSVPVALIVPFDLDQITEENREQGTESHKAAHYLVVAKISADEVCVTDKFQTDANAPARAREAADSSRSRPCLPGREAERRGNSAQPR